ncbi:MAG: hypothetical protein K8T20_00430 [Planctomycetes bacterium]|nr:hypothetical protein [Planctomycetota bacterium]
MRAATLLALLALSASADVLNPALRAQVSGGNVALRLEGTADLPRAATDWAPLVDVEYLFAPLRPERRVEKLPGGLNFVTTRLVEGREVSLGFGRARILSDAVEDNPPYLDARPFLVAGRFAGVYRARLVFDPARQSVRIRARGLPAATAAAEVRFGNPDDFEAQVAELRASVEEDAAALGFLARGLQGMWTQGSSTPRGGEEWTAALEDWRSRFEPLPGRNEHRPANAIATFMPAARSAIGEACEALAVLAEACDRAMALPIEKRRAVPEVDAAARRVREALSGVDRAAGRRELQPDLDQARGAVTVLRAAPAVLRAWYSDWRAGKPGHDAADWTAFRARTRESLTEALFVAGHASAPGVYPDLAAVARLLVADLPAGPGRNPSLLSAYSSRILKETATPFDEGWFQSCEQELAARLGRIEKGLESK